RRDPAARLRRTRTAPRDRRRPPPAESRSSVKRSDGRRSRRRRPTRASGRERGGAGPRRWYDVVRWKVQLADADVAGDDGPGTGVVGRPRPARAIRGRALEQRNESEHRRAIRVVLALTVIEHSEPHVFAG